MPEAGNSRIRLLDDHLVSKIAAGEVIERPASVLKELVENSLDAGATRVVVNLESGGKRRIRVADDGSGMGRDDALLAFDRHATSKIASFEDLEQVGTLGFRGEALSSIAAVARVDLLTAESDGEGHRVRIEGERIRSARPDSRRRGTTIEIGSLFFNVPARRSFLKKGVTELRRCVEVVQGYALARPDASFELLHEGRELLNAPAGITRGLEALRARVGQVFGPEFARDLNELPKHDLGSAARARGLVGKPGGSKGRRIFVFVNGRLIRDRAVLAIFYRSVRDQWKTDDFPALFLFLEVEPSTVDVNVHPQKAEVRFRDSSLIDRLRRYLAGELARARGDEGAPLSVLHPGLRPAPTAWTGLGQQSSSQTGSSEIHEGWAPSHPAQKLAEVSYQPIEAVQVRLSGRSTPAGSLRLLGQYKGTLLLLEGVDGLYLIDQHVAHERVLYERFRIDLEGDSPESQTLLEPMVMDLAPSEAMRLSQCVEALASCGFDVISLSGSSVGVRSVPASLLPSGVEPLLRGLASSDNSDADLRSR
ncbi:MAG: DNA mismatch repair endonuclease MutL, partial [Acidobacteriota bacterium]|nr:DNA mismatch repair endonuclease MutL [Acidobacteriota bacterium]